MSDIEIETYVNDDLVTMDVHIHGDEVAWRTHTDGEYTGWEIETLDRWNAHQPERENEGWRKQS